MMWREKWVSTGKTAWRDTGRPPKGKYHEQEKYTQQVSLKTGAIRWKGSGRKRLCVDGDLVTDAFLYGLELKGLI